MKKTTILSLIFPAVALMFLTSCAHDKPAATTTTTTSTHETAVTRPATQQTTQQTTTTQGVSR